MKGVLEYLRGDAFFDCHFFKRDFVPSDSHQAYIYISVLFRLDTFFNWIAAEIETSYQYFNIKSIQYQYYAYA